MFSRFPWLRLVLRLGLGLTGIACLLVIPMLVIGHLLPYQDWIAFMYNRDDTSSDWDIYALDVQSGLVMPVINTSMNERFPEWSPDGTQIAYHADPVERWRFDLFVADANGRNARRLNIAIHREDSPYYDQTYFDEAMVSWSPDGGQILFHSGAGNYVDFLAFIHDLTTEETWLLIDSENEIVFPTWSPDGKQIVFALSEQQTSVPSHYAYMEISQLYVMNVGDSFGSARQITRGDSVYAPAWSPDGSMLAYVVQTGLSEEIYVVNADGSSPRNVTNSRRYRNRQPEWLPDGSGIVFASDREGHFNLYVINLDGSGLRRLTYLPGDAQAPSWKPRNG